MSAADEEAGVEQQRREVAAYERSHPEVIPGTARHGGDKVGAYGGVLWTEQARMAAARRAAGVPLNDRDRDALDRHPQPEENP